MDLINSTKNIQWNKLVDDIQLMLNENLKLNETWNYVSNTLWKNNVFTATLFSVLFVMFYWSIIYLDSNKPGENPPTPFTSVQKRRFRYQKQAQFHLNYVTGALIGALLFISICFRLFDN